ncbi:MAG: MMPL family transporter, partial [Gammaproteobacteria bacterium]
MHRLDFDNDTWLAPDNPRRAALETFRAEFEPDEALLLVIALPQDFFRAAQTRKIRELDEALAALPESVSVLSPLSATTIIDTGDTLEIGSFADALDKKFLDGADAYRAKFLASPYAGKLLSLDGRTVLLRVAIPRIDAAARARALAAIAAVARAHGFGDAHFAGESALKGELNRITREQLPLLLALSALMLAVFLRLACGNWPRACVIFTAAVAAVASCLGLMAAFGWPMNAVLLVLPVMVAVIAVADGLHILATWDALAAQPPRMRLANSIRQTWLPCLGATLTSAAGFGAFAVSELTPLHHFGLASALTILYAYPLITGALWGALWMLPQLALAPPRRLPWARLLAAFERMVHASPRRIVFGALCIAALLGGGLALVRTETNFLAVFFAEDSAVRRAFDLVDSDLGGSGRV